MKRCSWVTRESDLDRDKFLVEVVSVKGIVLSFGRASGLYGSNLGWFELSNLLE